MDFSNTYSTALADWVIENSSEQIREAVLLLEDRWSGEMEIVGEDGEVMGTVTMRELAGAVRKKGKG